MACSHEHIRIEHQRKDTIQWNNEHEDDSMTGRINTYLGYHHPLLDKYMDLRMKMEMSMKQELELQARASGDKMNT